MLIFFASLLFTFSSHAIENTSHESAIESASQSFLGKPYLVDPLGEGPSTPPDTDPVIRFDKFDCQTFVETVLAMAWSSDSQKWKERIIQIRYKSEEVRFDNRNHFVELDWIQNNTGKKILKDITSKLFPKDQLETFQTEIIISNIYKPLLKQNVSSQIPREEPAKLTVVPLKIFLGNFDISKIPNASIIVIAHKNWFSKTLESKLLVSHMGFVFQIGDKTSFRHAARKRQVEDAPLKDYLLKNYGASQNTGVLFLQPFPDN